MKNIIFTIAAISGIIWIYHIIVIMNIKTEMGLLDNQIHAFNQKVAVYDSDTKAYNSFGNNAGKYVRSFFDGFTLGVFADEGVFTEAKRMEREADRLRRQSATFQVEAEQLNNRHHSVQAKYGDAVEWRNGSLIAGIGFLIVGLFIKKTQ